MKTQKIHYDKKEGVVYAGGKREQGDTLLGWAVPLVPVGWHFSPQKDGLTYSPEILGGIADVLDDLEEGS